MKNLPTNPERVSKALDLIARPSAEALRKGLQSGAGPDDWRVDAILSVACAMWEEGYRWGGHCENVTWGNDFHCVRIRFSCCMGIRADLQVELHASGLSESEITIRPDAGVRSFHAGNAEGLLADVIQSFRDVRPPRYEEES